MESLGFLGAQTLALPTCLEGLLCTRLGFGFCAHTLPAEAETFRAPSTVPHPPSTLWLWFPWQLPEPTCVTTDVGASALGVEQRGAHQTRTTWEG